MIRSEKPMKLHLARHAEAFKNREKRHGGGDQRLTPIGIHQAYNIGRYLLRNAGVKYGEISVVHQPEGRSELTAGHANEVLGGKLSRSEELTGIDLGSRAGLSEAELNEQFPEIAEGIRQWRTNKVGFNVPETPDGESMDSFSKRILKGMTEGVRTRRHNEPLLIVGTTSTLVMMNHMLEYDGQFHGPGYAFVDAPLGSVSSWVISDKPPIQVSNLIVPGEI